MKKPKADSRKGENGKLLVIGGSEKIHGAPLLAIRAAAKIVDLIYFYSPEKGNQALLREMRSKTCLFITVKKSGLEKAMRDCDCVLIGNGLEVNAANAKLVASALKLGSRVVLDAGALRMAKPECLKRGIITPHAGEFKALFECKATKENAKRMAAKHSCTILLKGSVDFVTDGRRARLNRTGNAGMTKGGTGDSLAGLTAALHCKNPAFESALAAARVNGTAGNLAFKADGYAFDAEDLIAFIPRAIKKSRVN